jgi:hypothetical protein
MKITISCQKLVLYTNCYFFGLYNTEDWVLGEWRIGEDLKEIPATYLRPSPVSFLVRLRKPRHVLIRIAGTLDGIQKRYL